MAPISPQSVIKSDEGNPYHSVDDGRDVHLFKEINDCPACGWTNLADPFTDRRTDIYDRLLGYQPA